jgi:hypothetical protein
MRISPVTLRLLIAAFAAALPLSALAAEKAPAAKGASDAQLIASALRAAPAAVAKNASVATMDDKGMHSLRKGTNGFTCMPDNPATPGPDPMCMDAAAMDWANAWMSKKSPTVGKVGLIYMLEGGTDASNTDPHAAGPAPRNNWVETGPHVMIVGAKGMMEGYPRDPQPYTKAPYVMWADTPYEHLMVPVR